MKIRLDKTKLTTIENAFAMLIEQPDSETPCDLIKKALDDSFPECKFTVWVIKKHEMQQPEFFVMSVFPEYSVVDKIILATMENKETKVIQKLWETNKKWVIEIDEKILTERELNFTSKELTAMLLHEVGHIVCSTSIPNRVSLILRYELMNTKFSNKALLKTSLFRKIMALPILDICIDDGKKDMHSIKEEVKADAFAKKYGYTKELIDALSKLSQYGSQKKDDMNTKLIKDSRFALSTLDEFQQRKDKLAKGNLLSLVKMTESPYIKDFVNEFVESVFEDNENSKSVVNGRKIEFMHERADSIINDEIMMEFFILKKTLKKIDPADLDYIYSKIQTMETEYDRMIIVSYIHSKLDLVEYYISILENPEVAKQYNIIQPLPVLKSIKLKLLDYRKLALKHKIADVDLYKIMVAYPTGYEG